MLKSTEPPCEVVGEQLTVLRGACAVHVEDVVEEFGPFEWLGAVFVAEEDAGS